MRKGAPMEKGVEIKEIVEKMDLKNLTPEIEMEGKKVEVPDINRPALQLSGFLIILMQNVYKSLDMWNIHSWKLWKLKERKRSTRNYFPIRYHA